MVTFRHRLTYSQYHYRLPETNISVHATDDVTVTSLRIYEVGAVLILLRKFCNLYIRSNPCLISKKYTLTVVPSVFNQVRDVQQTLVSRFYCAY
jgi:hypothetical protein